MNKLNALSLILAFMISLPMVGQENVTYQKPPAEILQLVDIERAPAVNIDSKGEQIVFFYRNTFKTLADLNQPEMRLAGLRINPDANISSTTTYYNNIKVKRTNDSQIRQIEGLPQDARIANISFSPDEKMMAFTNTTANGLELWLIDFTTDKARKLTDGNLNANVGRPFSWYRDGSALFVNMLPEDRKPLIDTKTSTPSGPIVSVSDGEISQNRTYQDMLKNATDEANFDTLIRSELYKVSLTGEKTRWKEAGLYIDNSFSPDGNYVMLTTLQKPYSYVVPYYSFPDKTEIYTIDGEFVMKLNEQPLLDNLPVGFMATQQGKRNIGWRGDKPATLYWVEALDGGDPEVKVDYRDEVFELDAPFSGKPHSLVKTINRYSGIIWGNSDYAILTDRWWNTRNRKMYVFNPSDNTQKPRVFSDINYQDVYSNPGELQTSKNEWGRYTLTINKGKVYLFGEGFTPKGQFPFIDEMDLKSLKKKRIYQSAYTDRVESLSEFIDLNKGTVLVRIESPTDYPNYYVRNIKNKREPKPLTAFENPFKAIANVHKEVITYKREDGVELSGTLYLPVGYDMNKKEKLPMIMWAYPTEYKDKNSAGQTTANANTFTYLSYGNPIYWVTRGYAVLDDAAFPIIGEGDHEPNDTFIQQLVANAKAAIDAVDKLGYIDRNRVAVGGHSYGAFMTANLLSHSDLFAAGIARSGAYNRTLTPFGFQSEQRNYWQAKEVYDGMSPFMHADKMKTPMLLIHGEADNNSGTHTMQSERYFQALKSFGAPVRMVILPSESHGYAARENVLHLLWEQDQWLEKYVKNRK